MSRIKAKFEELKNKGRKGLIAYVTAGCPDFATTRQVVTAMEQAGADVIEIGIPFSDPMADGPVIQKAATMALQAGATSSGVLQLVADIRKQSDIPLVAMTYLNTILNYGSEKFVADFASAGLDGLIVPDMPAEEGKLLTDICRENGIDLIQFVAPTTTPERIADICAKASGFLYCISTTGVTGVREVDYSPIASVMVAVREKTTLPLAIGFGIGTPEAARRAAQHAEAVIVGSAIVQALMDNGVEAVEQVVRSIRQGLDQGV